MEFVKTHYESLNDNYKRLVTLVLATVLTFTVMLFFPVNVLMIYSLIRAYSKNKVNLLLGMKEEALELYEQLKSLRNADSLQSNEEEDEASSGSTDNNFDEHLTEEETKKAEELTSMTEEDVAGILSSMNSDTKDPVLKKAE